MAATHESRTGAGKCNRRAAFDVCTVSRLLPLAERIQGLNKYRFAGQVKLQSILIRTSNDSSAPKTLKLFINCENLDFDTASEAEATEVLELAQDPRIQEYPVKRHRFTMTRSLTIFFEDNWGAETTKISYLGFKGEFMALSKEPVSVLYESAANPSDHQRLPGIGMALGQGIGPS